jgi:hypothetical protein
MRKVTMSLTKRPPPMTATMNDCLQRTRSFWTGSLAGGIAGLVSIWICAIARLEKETYPKV